MPEQRTRGVRRAPRKNGAGADKVANIASGAKESVGGLADGDPGEDLGTASGAIGDVAGARAPQTVRSELSSIARDAAIEVLGPVVRNATTQAAKYAVRKGPQLAVKRLGPKLMDSVGPAIQEAGGPAALAKGALSSVSGRGDGLLSRVRLARGGRSDNGDERGSARVGRGRRLPVEESVDIGASLEAVYNQFTQFEDFTRFMFRAEKVEQTDDTHLVWTENIWGIRRKLEVEIIDQEPNARIAWKSETGTQSTGVVTFHRLDERLTRVLVTHDFQPHGVLEKSALRMSRRALKSDLMRFKAFIELREDETGAWTGQVEDGEVVDGGESEPTRTAKATRATKATKASPKKSKPARSRGRAPEPEPEEEYEDEEAYEEEDQPEAFEDEEPEAYEEEDEAEPFEDEGDDDDDGDQEEEEAPVRRRPIRRRAAPVRQRRGR